MLRSILMLSLCLSSLQAKDVEKKTLQIKAKAESALPLIDESSWEIPAWKKWKEKYASSSTLRALQKISLSPELQVPMESLDQVLQGKIKIKFDLARKIKDRPIKEFDLFELADSRRFEVFNQADLQILFNSSPGEALDEKTRFMDMKNNVLSLIKNRKPNELILIQVGETHAHDLYFSYFLQPPFPPNHPRLQWRNDVVYFGNTRRNEMYFQTEDYYKLQSLIDGVTYPKKTLGENSVFFALPYLSRLAYYYKLQASRYEKEKLLEEVPARLGTLVMMDLHGLNSVDAIKGLPSAAALKAAGFDSFTFVMEGQGFGKDFKEDELLHFYLVSEDYIPEKDKKFFQERRKEAYALMKKTFVQDPFTQALHQKIIEYRRSGITIRLTGSESVDRFKSPQEKKNKNK